MGDSSSDATLLLDESSASVLPQTSDSEGDDVISFKPGKKRPISSGVKTKAVSQLVRTGRLSKLKMTAPHFMIHLLAFSTGCGSSAETEEAIKQ